MMAELGRTAFEKQLRAVKKQRGKRTGPADAEVRRRLGEAVKAGHITEAEAKEHWIKYEKSKAAGAKERDAKPTEAEMAELKKKIRAAAEAGHLSKAQAEERWQAYLKHVRGG